MLIKWPYIILLTNPISVNELLVEYYCIQTREDAFLIVFRGKIDECKYC